MSPRDLTFEALDFIAVDTIAAASARQLARIARDLTATMQQIYAAAPALYKKRDGARIADPQQITVTVTQGAITLTTASTIIDGSTIFISADAVYNIVRVDGGTKTLTLPFKGASGTWPATVWNDSFTLGATVDRVIGAVQIDETFPLEKRNNRSDAFSRYWPEPDFGRLLRTVANRGMVGRPDAYWVEAVMKSDGSAASHESRLRLHVYPLPNHAYTLGYDVRLKAPRFVPADLGTDATDSPMPLVVAADMIESVVRPLFLKRWTASPWWRNKEALDEIKDQAESAVLLLQQYRPQQQSNRRIFAPL